MLGNSPGEATLRIYMVVYMYLTPPEIVHEDRVENLGSLVILALFGYGLGLRNPGWPSGRTSRRGNTVRPGPLP